MFCGSKNYLLGKLTSKAQYLRDKAVEIANEVFKTTGNKGEAIVSGPKAGVYPLCDGIKEPAKPV